MFSRYSKKVSDDRNSYSIKCKDYDCNNLKSKKPLETKQSQLAVIILNDIILF